MWNLFKPKDQPPAPRDERNRPAAARPSSVARPPVRKAGPSSATPAPLPEVTEGNQDSDWALWEDSVAFQDSQTPSGFNALESVRTHEAKPPADGSPDPYGKVRRRDS